MINLPSVPRPDILQYLDKIIVPLQVILKDNLAWLDYSFGQSQRLIQPTDGKTQHYPAIHISGGAYQSVFPDQDLGNFSFFTIADPQEVEYVKNGYNTVKAEFSLIFWFNLDTIFEGSTDRNKELIKADIMHVLTREVFLTRGSIEIKGIQEIAENIYKEFNINEINSQYLMQPYCGLRFDGNLIYKEGC